MTTGTAAMSAPGVCTISITGQQFSSRPSPFYEDGHFWTPAADAEKWLKADLIANGTGFRLNNSSVKIPGLSRAGVKWVCLEEMARAVNAVCRTSGVKLDVLARVTDVRFAGGKLLISASLPVNYKLNRLQSPDRIYVDILGAALEGPQGETQSRTSVVRALRIGQHDATTVRVVAETAGRLACEIQSPARTNSIVLAIGASGGPVTPKPPPLTTIARAQVDTLEQGIRVSMDADGTPSFTVGADYDKFRYWVDLDRTLVKAEETSWRTESSLASEVRLNATTSAPPRARVTVDGKRVLIPAVVRSGTGKLVFQVSVPKGAHGDWRNKRIVFDPGHGGTQPGARGNGINEKDVNLAIARAAADEAERRGLNPILTRSGDSTLSLGARTDRIASSGADLFVSIHNNSNGRANSASGTEVYYHKQEPNSRALAQVVHDSVVKAASTRPRGARSDSTLYNSGLFVLRNSSVPAILVEVGYVNHSGDASRLKSPEFQQKVAKAIVDGIMTYLGGPAEQGSSSVTAQAESPRA